MRQYLVFLQVWIAFDVIRAVEEKTSLPDANKKKSANTFLSARELMLRALHKLT